METKPLTIKQAKFLKLYIETGNATQAALKVYNCQDENSAGVIGNENLRKLKISSIVQAELAQAGLTKEYRLKRLKDLIDAHEWQPIAKGLDMSFKLANEYPSEQQGGINIDKALFQIQVVERNPEDEEKDEKKEEKKEN